MTITQQHKNLALTCILTAAGIYFAPSIIVMLFRAGHPTIRPARRAAAQAAPLSPDNAAAAPFRAVAGIYNGRAQLAGRGNCALRFELRNSPKPGAFAGYSTLTCAPLVRQWSPYMAYAALPKATSAILSGAPDGDAINFHVDDVIAADDCMPTGFVLKGFGQNQIAVKWQDSCRGGYIVLRRAQQ